MKLQNVITMYLDFKHALGMRMESEGKVLRQFCRHLNDPEIHEVSSAAVRRFLDGQGPLTHSWKQKASVLRSFYRFAIAREMAVSMPLPAVPPIFPPLRAPHVYSTLEIKRLLTATRVLHSARTPLRAAGFRTLLLLLYGTGMRLGEAINLTIADVDFDEQIITVRNTKFFKSRLVPFGRSLGRALRDYAVRRAQGIPLPAGRGSPFFARPSGSAWDSGWTEALFDRIRTEARLISLSKDRPRPRLHDLRHTRVQHQILSWYRAGRDVQHLLPKLATYLGHVDIASLQHYVAITPELLNEANRRFERYARLESRHE